MTERDGIRFDGRTPGASRWRVALVAGSLLALVTAATVTIGASPAPSGRQPGESPGASPSAKPKVPGHRWLGGAPFGRLDRIGRLGAGRGVAFGDITITAIDGERIALATEDGWTRTITVSDATPITKAGRTITRGELKVGDSVRFGQTRNSDGTFTVTRLAVVLPRVAGEVTAKTADTITIRRRDRTTMTVRVSGSTTYRVAGAENGGGLGDVTVGMWLIAEGTQNADGSLDAARVAAGQRREIRFPFRGPKERAPRATPAPGGSPAPSASPTPGGG